MNISGILVQSLPNNIENVKKTLNESGLCEIHFEDTDTGKIIITIEGANVGEEMEKLKQIEQLPGVVFANMIHSYSADELTECITKLENGDAVPNVLLDDNLNPSEVVYNGDVRTFTGK